jgi:hypothetical protein
MENILPVLKNVLGDNYISILIITIGWIPIFYLKLFSDWFGPVLILRLPFYFQLTIWERRYMPQIIEMVKTENYKMEKLFSRRNSLNSLLINFDNKVSKSLLNQKSSVINLFPSKKVLLETNMIYEKYVAAAESYLTFCDVLMQDKRLKYSAILNLANGSSFSHDEIFNTLKWSIKLSEKEFRVKYFYAIILIIEDQEELNEIEEITKRWTLKENGIISNEIMNLKSKFSNIAQSKVRLNE